MLTCTEIYLFAPALGKVKGMSSYPMVIPGSMDYGSVHIKLPYKGDRYSVKIYPRLVHVIKVSTLADMMTPVLIHVIMHVNTGADSHYSPSTPDSRERRLQPSMESGGGWRPATS